MHPHEGWIIRRYLGNAIKSRRFDKPPSAEADICVWIEANALLLDLPPFDRQETTWIGRARSGTAPVKEHWLRWRKQAIQRSRSASPSPSPLQARIDWLAGACALSASQRWMLGIFARFGVSPIVAELVAALADRAGLDMAISDVSELKPLLESDDCQGRGDSAYLVRLGLISTRDEPRLSDIVAKLLLEKRLTDRNVANLLLGKPAAASLPWDAFAHLGEMRDLAARLVLSYQSKISTECGANLLFYGQPGSGKSEFAKTLGAHVGHSVQFVGETDDNELEPDRRQRIAALMIANAIEAVARETLIVVDEADDLFAGVDEDDAAMRQGSKVFMNGLVERTTAPTIWITNDVARLGPAVIRRMNLVLRFPSPSLKVRKDIVQQVAKRAGLPLDEEGAAGLAQLPAQPALLENAIRSASRIGGGAGEARVILKAGLRALGGRNVRQSRPPISFDPGLSAADVNLSEFADKIAASASSALSFCLSGPPGTGKSAYARHLADRLELEVLEKRYSDIAAMYLGQSEKAIAAAFEEAADLGAFLILDEADFLLRDRTLARNSWEVTQVNEMLTWMERHPYPLACTTNAAELLDPATSRRFLFKVRFLAMNAGQITEAFLRAFGCAPPRLISELETLTPGDFANVARRVAALDEQDMSQIAKWIEQEALSKPNAPRRRIGF